MTISDRCAGLAVPLFSLRSTRGGAVGEIPDLVPLARWARSMGQGIIQILPVNETRPGEASPYAAMSAFAIDPLYLRLSAVSELRGVEAVDAEHRGGGDAGGVIPRDALRRSKLHALAGAWTSLRMSEYDAGGVRGREFLSWAATQARWLDDYALFQVLSERYPGAWQTWPDPFARRAPDAMAGLCEEYRERIDFFRYVQFLCFGQWAEARGCLHDLDVHLMGDLPFVLGGDSVDAWSEPALFKDGWTVGAPPDDFSASGQNWHLPLYAWEAMRQNGFAWWRRRVEQASTLFNAFRIDHIVGVFRTYSIPLDPSWHPCFHPWDEAEQNAQGEEFLTMACAAAGGAQPVAEDLGTIPAFVRDALRRHRVPGYAVMRWERDASGYVDPDRYAALSIATTGTHDTTTLAAWWRELTGDERRRFGLDLRIELDAASATGDLSADVRRRVLERLYRGAANWVILPIQDLFGWTERINVPMTTGGANWNFRLPFAFGENGEVPADIVAEAGLVADLVRACGRADAVEKGDA